MKKKQQEQERIVSQQSDRTRNEQMRVNSFWQNLPDSMKHDYRRYATSQGITVEQFVRAKLNFD